MSLLLDRRARRRRTSPDDIGAAVSLMRKLLEVAVRPRRWWG